MRSLQESELDGVSGESKIFLERCCPLIVDAAVGDT